MIGHHVSAFPMSDSLRTVVLIEDDPGVQLAAAQALQIGGFEVLPCDSAEQAQALLKPDFPGVVVCDVRLPGKDGLTLLRELHRADPDLPVTLVTGHGDVAMAVEAMREGAWDFIEKPFASERLIDVTRRAAIQRQLVLENRRLKAALSGTGRLIGASPAMERIRTLVANLGPTGVDVLIEGETGAGKEVVAQALHEASGASGPFVAINCGALPETVFESEIFGAEPGAYTGATKRRIGKLEHARDGTVFLDEIESMPLALQVKLLRVLQERSFERLGGNTVLPLQARVIAATKVDLKALADRGGFRADLYYRLNVATLALPPLRERREDIPLLLTHFAELAGLRFRRPVPRWGAAQMAAWQARDWPGNVRELRHLADRWVLGLEDTATEAADRGAPEGAPGDGTVAAPRAGLEAQLEAFERGLIEAALRESQGSVSAAAAALDLPRKTLSDRIRRLGLDAESFRLS
jgi:two-component system C4-dicarboxylate transport response regulator DctD